MGKSTQNFCKYCQCVSLCIQELKSGDEKTISHQPNETSLTESAKTCPWCAVFREELLCEFGNDAESGLGLEPFRVTLELRGQLMWLDFNACRDDFLAWSKLYRCLMTGMQENLLTLPSLQQTVLSIDNRLPIVEKWIAKCDSCHSNCQEYRQKSRTLWNCRFRPSRLLDVGPSNGSVQPKLILGKDIETDEPIYTALSHCWGPEGVPFSARTTKANEENHKQGIVLDNLPLTFRDAIKITRSLKVRYLWIDSLAIVQDDVQDWQTEAASMANIFESAYLTLAATSSTNSHGGLKLEVPIQKSPFALPETLRDGAELTQVCFPAASQGALWKSPLNSRGWVLQELALSKRTIHFATDQLYWQCHEQFASEDGTIKDTSFHSIRPSGSSWRRDPDGLASWRQIARDYSTRSFTYAQDRLPAMAGLVYSQQRVTVNDKSPKGMTPVLGLWLESLHLDLCWMTSWKPQRVLPLPIPVRFGQVELPSWSWLSSNSEIEHWLGASTQSRLTKKLEVVDWAVEWAAEPYTSGLLSWHLVVKSGLRNLGLPPGMRLRDAKNFVHLEMTPDPSHEMYGSVSEHSFIVISDIFDAQAGDDTLSCLHLFDDHDCINRLHQVFLVLLPVKDRRDAYRRVGVGRSITHNLSKYILFFGGSDEQTISLL